VAGALAQRAAFHAPDRLAHYFVGPGAGPASRLIRPVEVDHHLIFRGLLEQPLVMVDDFLGFVVKEVDLGTGDPQAMQSREKLIACLRRAQSVAVYPEQQTHTLLP